MILEVEPLKVQFPTRRGTLPAVDAVSFSSAPGEVLGVVGESGAGKSITGMAVIGLLDPPGRIAAGEVRLEGRRIDNLPHEELRRIRGRRIGVIFQDPLTSLNPLYTIGQQLEETILTHLDLSPRAARERGPSVEAEVVEARQSRRLRGSSRGACSNLYSRGGVGSGSRAADCGWGARAPIGVSGTAARVSAPRKPRRGSREARGSPSAIRGAALARDVAPSA